MFVSMPRKLTSHPLASCLEYLRSKDVDLTRERSCEVIFINEYKGCGVFAKEDIEANTFLFEYEGKLLTKEEGMKILSSSSGPGYLFFFGKNHCIDATSSQGMGRMVNDSVTLRKANCVIKEVVCDGTPHLCVFVAGNYIKAGTELVYYYGQTDEHMFWRKGKQLSTEQITGGNCVTKNKCPFLTSAEESQTTLLQVSLPKPKAKSRTKTGFCEVCNQTFDCLKTHIRTSGHKDKARCFDSLDEIIAEVNANGGLFSLLPESRERVNVEKGKEEHGHHQLINTNQQQLARNDEPPDEEEEKEEECCEQLLSSENKQSEKVEEIQQSLVEVDKDCNHQLIINTQQLAESEPLDEEECCDQVLSSESKQSEKVEEIQQSLVEVDKDCNHQLIINTQQLAESEPLDEEECCDQVLSSESKQSEKVEEIQQSLVEVDKDCNHQLIINTQQLAEDEPLDEEEEQEEECCEQGLSSESKQSDKVEEIQQSLVEVDKDGNHQLTINKQQLAEDEPLDEEEETEDECCEQVLSSESEQSDEEEDRQQSLVQAMHVQCGNSNNSDSEQEEDSYIAESVTLRSMKQENGRRNRNKFPCNYCPQFVFEYARHVLTRHSNKKKVAAILKKPKGNRSKAIAELRAEAVNKHNAKVLDFGKGELIVGRRSTVSRKSEHYLPCPRCRLLFSSKQLWRHHQDCGTSTRKPHGQVKTFQKRKCLTRHARLLMEIGLGSRNANIDFTMDVLGTLRPDEVSAVIKKDALICMYGVNLYKKLGRYRSTEIAQKLRLLARLLMVVNSYQSKSSNQHAVTLCDCIGRKHFDEVLDAVKEIAGAKTDETGRNVFTKPSLGTKLGHCLVKCAKLKKREGIRCGSRIVEKEADTFLALHSSDWADHISSQAIMTLKMKKTQGPEALPDTDDLVKLKDHIDNKIVELMSKLKRRYSYSAYRDLLEYTLAALILFNKRRGGEAAKLLLTTYTNRHLWRKKSNKEIVQSLSTVEKKLVKRLDMVHIPGKKSRVVPMLILPYIAKAMDLLLEVRQKNHIGHGNKFFFASQSEDGCLSQFKILQRVANEAGLKHPDLVRSTKLRKYLATMAQIVSLTSGEQEWLSNHLGHEVNIDKDFYRTNDAVLEISKISRLLMVAHSGHMSKYAGKSLSDIGIEGGYLNKRNVFEPDSSDGDCTSNEEGQEELPSGSRAADMKTTKKRKKRLDYSGNESGDDHGVELNDVEPDSSDGGDDGSGSDCDQEELLLVSRSADIKPTKKRRKQFNSSGNESSVDRGVELNDVEPNSSDSGDETDDGSSSDCGQKEFPSGSRLADIKTAKKTRKQCNFSDNDSSGGSQEHSPDSSRDSNRKMRTATKKWSQAELNLLKKFQKLSKAPRAKEIRQLIEKHPILRGRTEAQIKTRALYMQKTGR